MAIEARRGLKWAEDGRAGSGLVPRTVADARKMADREPLSEQKVRKMPGWFARHEVDMASDANRDPDDPQYPGAGRVAWALWGGDAGRSWAEKKVAELDREKEEAERSLKITVEVEQNEYPEMEEPEVEEPEVETPEEPELDDEEELVEEEPVEEELAIREDEPVQPAGDEMPPTPAEEEIPQMQTSQPLEVERVRVKLEELRVAGSGDPQKKNELVVTGYAALFDSRSEDLGGFVEEIQRGAFSESLRKSDLDVRFLINHDSNLVLARSKSGTLELSEDERGLRIYARVAPYSYAEDLRIAIERGDIDQMSFAFTVEEDSWGSADDGTPLRRVQRVKDLFDVSVVTYPAYAETKTEVLARAIDRGELENETETSSAEVVPAEERESSPQGEARTDQSPSGADLRRLRERIRSRT